jgi:hypothetical protein
VVVGALIRTGIVTLLTQRGASDREWTPLAASCIALSLVVFFVFTFPANQPSQNRTVLPENWASLRRQWEYFATALAVVSVGGAALRRGARGDSADRESADRGRSQLEESPAGEVDG